MNSINIGCGPFKIGHMINVDIRFDMKPQTVMDICNLGFRNECAFEINLGNIIEHLSPEACSEALRECYRVLVPGGCAYIVSPMVDLAKDALKNGLLDGHFYEHILNGSDEDTFSKHRMQFSVGDLEILAAKEGFSIEPLDLRAFPYLVVSNIMDPKPDPWQYGIIARK